MFCLFFTIAALLMALAGLCLMVGWKSGASQLARIAIALVIGSAIVSWFVDVLQASFSQPGVATVAGGFVVLFIVALILLAVGWFFKRHAEAAPASRPTIRRRVQLVDLSADTSQPLPAQHKLSTNDDLQLFGGGQ